MSVVSGQDHTVLSIQHCQFMGIIMVCIIRFEPDAQDLPGNYDIPVYGYRIVITLYDASSSMFFFIISPTGKTHKPPYPPGYNNSGEQDKSVSVGHRVSSC